MRPFYGPGALSLALLLAFATPGRAAAQNPAAEIEAVVMELFDAMRAADGPKAAALFHPDARLQSVGEQNGRPTLRTQPIAGFVEAVGQARDIVWDERIENLEIRIDGRLATAWMNYTFYLDDDLSHCGVNSVQLFHGDQGWQIIQIVDTRRFEGCGTG